MRQNKDRKTDQNERSDHGRDLAGVLQIEEGLRVETRPMRWFEAGKHWRVVRAAVIDCSREDFCFGEPIEVLVFFPSRVRTVAICNERPEDSVDGIFWNQRIEETAMRSEWTNHGNNRTRSNELSLDLL
ncbi:unnamed protein product [Caenorhabditis sp. 36 PRJEB53466]|nr:unnamed protein product [Caenorhabditis sp. 36 PRJEB53466]